MFSKSILAAFSALALATSWADAKPIDRGLTRRTELFSPPSFNNYLDLSTMSNFDDFFGIDNFNGFSNEQIIIEQEDIVCESIDIQIVQQNLIVLLEVMKEVILTQICEVEVQEIVFEQFSSYFSLFGSDLSHLSDNQASFDQNAVGLYSQLFGSDGSLNNGDLGFSGSDIGNSSIVPSGNNWDSQTSPASVSAAQNLTQSALNSTVSNSTSS